MSSAPPRSVVVIGAGLAGLAAAVRAKALGAEVRVLDPEPAGGKARTVAKGDWRWEYGPHFLTNRADAVFALAQDVKVADRIVPLGANGKVRYVVRGGKLRKAGPGLLSLAEMWGLATGIFKAVPLGDRDTVQDFLVQRFGASFADHLGNAMMAGIWAASPAEIAFESAFPTVAEKVREHGSVFAAMRHMPKPTRPSGSYAFPEGMGTLGDAARAHLGERAFVSATVDALERDPAGGWLLRTDGGNVRADAVVIASNAPEAAKLIERIVPDAAERLRTIRYSPVAVAHWIAKDAAFPRGFGWLSPAVEKRHLLGTIFVSDLFPERAPAGHRGFASMLGGTRNPSDLELDVQAVAGKLRAEHRDLTGQDVTIAGLEVVRHPRAVPLPEPGHAARVAAIHAALPEGLALAGAWCGAGAMNDAAHAGQVAAANLLRTRSGRSDAA